MSEQLIIASPDKSRLNNISLADFQQYIAGLKLGMKRQYDRNVNRDLSRQNSQGVFRRNITTALNEAYDLFLIHLEQLPPGVIESSTDEILNAFDNFIEELVQYALQKHRGSCALSNFPDEHNPRQDYIAEVLEETQKDWNSFAFQVGRILQDKQL